MPGGVKGGAGSRVLHSWEGQGQAAVCGHCCPLAPIFLMKGAKVNIRCDQGTNGQAGTMGWRGNTWGTELRGHLGSQVSLGRPPAWSLLEEKVLDPVSLKRWRHQAAGTGSLPAVVSPLALAVCKQRGE